MKDDCVILVPSCDAYADVWPLFLYGLRRCWPDRPYRIYFGTNERLHVADDVITLRSGEGLVWSNRLRDYLQQIEAPYVMLMLEDFILRAPVDSSLVEQAVALCRTNGLDCMRLIPRPPPQTRLRRGEHWHEVMPGEPYRISTQVAVWRRECLLDLLRPDESIWQFEVDGTKRAAGSALRIWAAYRALFPYEGLLAHHVIEKGRWIPHERWILQWRGYPVAAKVRPSMTVFQVLCYQAGESLVRLSRLVGEKRMKLWRERVRTWLPAGLHRRYQSARAGKALR